MIIVGIIAVIIFFICVAICSPVEEIGCVPAIIVLIIGFIIGIWIDGTIVQKTTRYEILSLQDVSQVKGRFFLGSGTINGQMVYTFYYKSGQDIVGQQLNWGEVTLRETTDKPHFDIITYKQGDTPKDAFAIDHIPSDQYIIYIPKGTIKQDFVLDAL
jgi:hypothetical protein